MESEVRDFIYLDVERLKSIVAQVEEGVSEGSTRTKGSTQQIAGGVEGGLLGVLKGATETRALWENREAETRSMHDFLYNKVEAALLERDLLLDIPGDMPTQAADAASWLPETAFFLAHGRVSINDFAQMRLVLDNLNEITGFIARCGTLSNSEQLTPQQQKKKERSLREELRLDPKLVKGFQTFFDTFYKDRAVIKLVPDPSNPTFRLVGKLERPFLRDGIDSITYKYGTSPSGSWTIFGQVASIPPPVPVPPMPVTGGGAIEQALHGFFDALREVESQAQSVAYPEVSITPIAVYRA